MEEWQVLVLVILFGATLTKSTFGFGDALVAMPLLSLVMAVEVATPLVALMAVTISGVILIKQWRDVHLKSLGMLIAATVAGLPVGVFLLKGLNDEVMKMILAGVIILFSLYQLLHPRLFWLKTDRWAFLFGILAGILGGAYNTNGPPVVFYGALRRWDPARFRATMQGYFVPTGGMIVIMHGIGGLWTRAIWMNYVYGLPLILVAIFLGGWLHRRIPQDKFNKYIYVGLFVLGVVLLINSIRW
ncbi:MAG: sulfite exporter TauE/SafE family protein [Planctomycetes bacterium]|nr:sulfite exporter TauE/SafE family protein [Planctomycetota bacterium]